VLCGLCVAVHSLGRFIYYINKINKTLIYPLSTLYLLVKNQFIETIFGDLRYQKNHKMRASAILFFATTALAFSEYPSLAKRQQFKPEVTTAEGSDCAAAFGQGYSKDG